jgi:hypothetical protein
MLILRESYIILKLFIHRNENKNTKKRKPPPIIRIFLVDADRVFLDVQQLLLYLNKVDSLVALVDILKNTN